MRGVTIFLSAPSARRATLPFGVAVDDQIISIHALREEGDPPSGGASSCWNYFYPRPPRGGRLSSSRKTTSVSPFLSTPSARRATFTFSMVVFHA